jgi:tetratricopeptide (TPR) repeat protein
MIHDPRSTVPDPRPTLSGSRLSTLRSPLSDLWQVPVFLLGVLAIVAVWLGRPWIGRSIRMATDHRFQEARQAIEAGSIDASRALALARELIEDRHSPTNRQAELHFVAGSAYVFLARQTRSDDAGPLWKKARSELEQAYNLGVSEHDRAKLLYRLGEVAFKTHAPLRIVIDCLAASVAGAADNPIEGYTMLTDAYLQQPVPDLEGALSANERLLALPRSDDVGLGEARLLRGELLLKLNRPEEARKVLARIPAGGSPELSKRTARLKAEVAEAAGAWAESAQAWEAIVKAEPDASPERLALVYRLGRSYQHLGRLADTERALRKALAADPETAQAAAIVLADALVLTPRANLALELFEQSVRQLAPPAEYRNHKVPVAEARQAFERGVTEYRKQGDYSRAARLVQVYRKLAEPGRADQLGGEIAEAWAHAGAGAETSSEVIQHFRDAGELFKSAAAFDSAHEAKWLSQSAECFQAAHEDGRALEILRRLLELETLPEQRGRDWFLVGQACQALHDDGAARTAYLKCIEYAGNWAFRARLEVARALAASNQLEDACSVLRQSLELMRGSAPDDIYEKTLITLGDLEMRRGEYRLAAYRYDEALSRFPGNPQSSGARKHLADCYRRLASQEDQNLRAGLFLTPEAQLHYRDQRRLWMQKAEANYHKLADDLAATRGSGKLSSDDELILREAGFAVADCHFELGDYSGAARLYEDVVGRYADRVEALEALKQITRCYWVERDSKKAKETVERVRSTLKSLSDSGLDEASGHPSRKEWQEWLDWASKQ